MKHTAVEWLVEQISSSKYFYNLMEDINSRNTVAQSNIFEQAKEMEKEQMRYFIQVGYYAHSQGHKKDEELYNYWIDNFNK